MDYEQIKGLAPRLGVTVEDLLALSTTNDPFYVGAPATLEKAQWFTELFDEYTPPWARCT